MRALTEIPHNALALMPWEEEHSLTLREALTARLEPLQPGIPRKLSPTSITVVLFIGPEGGLTAEEVTLAQRHGVRSVSLGPRILRAETAALAAVANVMYELED